MRSLPSLWTLPNLLTLGRLFLCGFFVFAIEISWQYSNSLALFFFIMASLTDWADGWLARRLNLVSNFGKLLDPLADKILISAALIALQSADMISVWVVVVVISREFLITGLRIISAQTGLILSAERVGKHKTITQMLTIIWAFSILSLNEFLPKSSLPLSEWVFYCLEALTILMVAVTVISAAIYFFKNRKIFVHE